MPAGVIGTAADLAAVDLLDAGFHTGDPHAVWTYMREHARLHRQEYAPGRMFCSVTRYDDVCRVLGDHDAFTSERGTVITQLGHDDIASGLLMTSCDPPRHTEVRRPLGKRLSAGAVHAMESGIRHAVDRVFADVPHDQPWDLAERALRLPMVVAGRLLGVPESDWDNLIRWAAMAAAPEDPDFAIGARTATLTVAHHQIFSYFTELIRSRRASIGHDDLLGHLLSIQAGAQPLSDIEAMYNSYSLLLGANATTPHTVSGAVLALARNPGAWRSARDDEARVPGLVEEALRWTSAASNFMRYATRPTRLSGGIVETGEPVVAWIGSANRDEAVFPDPHTFDITRHPNRHIAFGYGPHYCVGAPLARLTFRVVCEQFLRRFESVEIIGEPQRLRSSFINGTTHLRVRTTGREQA
ncbi:cytochrome P450 [Nocardia sp. NBC_00508]|uniref:cytochrome P450 n=1 Tax=Nocardia sp. NBC_00508 TaxID=2975992 RepID=UPI002E80C70D|nr:cytochrome P450 [Nocardia sp. NBC_00508]WUD66560.1 cytochrome P450 [Nocardia sp. NBC_00508]